MAVGIKHESTLKIMKNNPLVRSVIHSSIIQKTLPELQSYLRHWVLGTGATQHMTPIHCLLASSSLVELIIKYLLNACHRP